jgi:hypothetical protein
MEIPTAHDAEKAPSTSKDMSASGGASAIDNKFTETASIMNQLPPDVFGESVFFTPRNLLVHFQARHKSKNSILIAPLKWDLGSRAIYCSPTCKSLLTPVKSRIIP